MTPEQLNETFNASGLTQEKFARELKIGTSTLRSWLKKSEYSMWLANNIEFRVSAWQNRSKG